MVAAPNGLTVGILSSIGHPLLGPLTAELEAAGLDDYCVILDQKVPGERDRAIWAERTDGAFENDPTVYAFGDRARPFFLVDSHNGAACQALVERLGLRFLVNGGTPRKIGSAMLAATPQGVVNVHPGILPAYRGASCVEWAIYNNEPIGHTAHFMSEGYDDGPVIGTEIYDFSGERSYRAIRIAMYRNWCRFVAETVRKVRDTAMGPADAAPQGDGHEYRPIPDDKFREAIERVETGGYRPEMAP